jgi:hypothetical protein
LEKSRIATQIFFCVSGVQSSDDSLPRAAIFFCEVMNEYWKSGSFSQGDIESGLPPNLAPTMKLAAKKGRKKMFQQENMKKKGAAWWRRYEAYKNCTTTTAALANGCTMADLTWDCKHNFVDIFDPTL